MIALLDTIGPAVWRASWQAAVLGVLVAALLRILGERITPRWRYLAWSVVVARLLLVTTPPSPWSAFNLAHLMPEMSGPTIARTEGIPSSSDPTVADRKAQPAAGRSRATSQSPRRSESPAHLTAPLTTAHTTSSQVSDVLPRAMPSIDHQPRALLVVRILSSAYLAGCLVFGLRLLGAALVLRRRLSVCRPVTDPAVLAVLEIACERIGLRRLPDLLVTPESLSPFIVGTLRPRIILPESMVTEAPNTKLRHVLVHELAHLVRGDMWTNWLLLAARVLHWFNPVAWWVFRAMQGEREAACDDVALAALGETDRSGYASTIIDLAASLAPSGIAPGMIGLISSTRRLTSRIERLARSSSVPSLRSPVVASIVLGLALFGLTDAMPVAAARPSSAKSVPAPEQEKPALDAEIVTLRGHCEDSDDHSALTGVSVRLFKAEGHSSPIVEVAKCVTDRDGRFEFPNLTPRHRDDAIDPLIYLVFAEANDRPIGVGGFWNGQKGDRDAITIRIDREKTTLAGRVLDVSGKPVAGATVAQWEVDRRPVPGILSATTGPDGRFLITRIPNSKRLRSGSATGRGLSFWVSHPRYPQTELVVRELPKLVTVTLQAGCEVTGTVVDAATGRPASGAVVVAERLGKHSQTVMSTDAAGHFEIALPEDRYNFSVRAIDRVGIAITDRECLADNKLELPPIRLTNGGFIAGKVVNASTGKSIAVTEAEEPIAISLFGPSRPLGKAVFSVRMTTVDSSGRFKLRAAPGENFPYLVNFHGDRMAWDTNKQPPVVVKEGETTEYNMVVTPKIPRAEGLKAAQKVAESLPFKPAERTAQILAEFRKVSHTVDQAELWCTLMRELVTIGRDAVPQLSAELDRTTEDRTLRRLAFAARAIGDTRAVPALIRAIPRTLVPPSSDYGLIVADLPLAAFMQKHQLNGGPRGGQYFDFGRPVREVFGALQKLTGQKFDDSELFGLHRSRDPRRQWYQRRLLTRHAQRWQTWWEAHWHEFTDDAAYQRVNLKADDEPLPPPTSGPSLSPTARLDERLHGAVLSPAIQEGQYTEYFYDLDTGASPKWPAHIPRDEARFDPKQLADWAAESGVDLMCVTHRAPDGAQTFVLRSFGMKVWEISRRDLRNIDRLIAAGNLPKGHEAGELLVHYDEESKQSEPDANAAFIFVTREGCMGLIEITDRVTRTADLTGNIGDPPPGVGFQKGVRFNLTSIIP